MNPSRFKSAKASSRAINKIRRDMSWSWRDFSKATGVSVMMLVYTSAMKRIPSVDVLMRISEHTPYYFRITGDEIEVFYEGERK